MNDLESSSGVLVQCSFCKKDKREVDLLIAGHDDVYICDECVAVYSDERVECSFCFRKYRKNEMFFSSEMHKSICNDCVSICSGIVKKHK
ncbi:MAG: hypothetical protein OXG15_07520 [Gammaproteobacteria bacterium]|nr:hypothetical protein [Gammaproteobacteria bacterium]